MNVDFLRKKIAQLETDLRTRPEVADTPFTRGLLGLYRDQLGKVAKSAQERAHGELVRKARGDQARAAQRTSTRPRTLPPAPGPLAAYGAVDGTRATDYVSRVAKFAGADSMNKRD